MTEISYIIFEFIQHSHSFGVAVYTSLAGGNLLYDIPMESLTQQESTYFTANHHEKQKLLLINLGVGWHNKTPIPHHNLLLKQLGNI